MVILHTLSEFSFSDRDRPSQTVTDWYKGQCPSTGQWFKLPRTRFVEAIARGLMHQLAESAQYSQEGKMYGVLLVEVAGEQRVLKAFSGLLHGEGWVEGWVPPIPGREQIVLPETLTLKALESLKQELITLQQLPERQQYAELCQSWEQQRQTLIQQQQQRKAERQQQRQQLLANLKGEALTTALATLDQQSRQDGRERRQFKRQQAIALQPLKTQIDQADQRLRDLKQQRKLLSQDLQIQMHAAYSLTNFTGISRSLQQLMPGGIMPTGTGDCCAPKLLHYAASQGFTPLAMAEFWWGPAQGEKIPGEFYGACVERCQPLLGFLLAGLAVPPSLPILYEDAALIAIDKPAGLLSVPGRYHQTQDSVLSRLRQRFSPASLLPVHRLDQATSGILLLARDPQTQRQLHQQFQQRQVHKVYTAVLAGVIPDDQGVIDLPLWGNPAHRPYQSVDWQYGKPSVTRFQVLTRTAETTRLEFRPETGRTHQLRVHAVTGLGQPILGDRLYGDPNASLRLHLHASQLCLQHPQTGQPLDLNSEPPF